MRNPEKTNIWIASLRLLKEINFYFKKKKNKKILKRRRKHILITTIIAIGVK